MLMSFDRNAVSGGHQAPLLCMLCCLKAKGASLLLGISCLQALLVTALS